MSVITIERKLFQILMGNLVSQKLNGVADQVRNKIDDMGLSEDEKREALKMALDAMRVSANNFFIAAEFRLEGIQVGNVKEYGGPEQ